MFRMQRTKRSLKLAAVAAIASLLVAGCGGSDSPTPSAPDSTSTQSEPTAEPTTEPTTSGPTQSQSPDSQWNVKTSVATYVAVGDGWDGALLEGNLLLLDTGCLVVREKAGENAFIPVFPVNKEAVEFDGETLRLGAQSFKVGDKISLGGSALEWSDEYPELDYTMPDACSDFDTWWASPQGM